MPSTETGSASAPAAPGASAWRRAFCLCVLCLAIFQFSENTADPDLWAHVLFGRQFLQTGALMQTDPYSWTANGHAWINHEVLAEAALGLAHRWWGGTGLLLLKMAVGLLTFGLALSMALRSMNQSARPMAWAFGALAVVEISFGFAARPQIFTALALAVQLWILQQIHRGRWQWVLALPPLFVFWINTHGGVLAGALLLFVAAAATTAQWLFQTHGAAALVSTPDQKLSVRVVVILWISAAVATASLLVNPWGAGLVRWLIGSVLWLRPEIAEWNSTVLAWDHAAFFCCALLAVVAFLCSRRPRSWWQIAVTAVLGLMAFRSVRHTPLFCIAALAFVPPHLADVLQRFRAHFWRWEELGQRPGVKKTLTTILWLASIGILAATFTLHKERAWTMEVPRRQYPVSAVQFIHEHGLRGNLLVFFDWGEMCIWELPDSRVSLDGRLDTCYPRDLIDAHWKFYNGEPAAETGLDLGRADFALLPANLAGTLTLVKQSGWVPVYLDGLAVVLVKNPNQFPKLNGLTLPVQGGPPAIQGRAPFPASPPPAHLE
ncbi:MAG TPA: hypothetical protein VMB80_15675 [Candidatus Acidoferrum sp.]|nr:hypothetical protein [Candidatus Acidoferrum sp.]